ncbi:MAG: T9SS type A sorting domain-containing protein [Bacteroidales bacterium]|nr:T9SS type A sorting domain-containing protein [Bacteroidales bacterium]
MKKISTFFAACLLCSTMANAQQTMSINNGSFEQWTTTQGYRAMNIFPLFDDYITPTGWHTMKYAVDTTVSTFHIQMDVPLQIMAKDSGSVPDGNYGAMLQTFQLTDVLTGLSTLGLSLGDFDTVVLPTILSIGELETEPVMQLMALLPTLMSDPSAATMLDTLDFSNYSTGGMNLNGFNLGKLTGKYKYEPANNSADVGGIILIATYNDQTSGKRKICGGGFNTNLTHSHTYTDFEVDYMPLLDDPTIVPDMLEVMIMSSASNDMAKGSQLFVDKLQLVEAQNESIATAKNEPSVNIYPNPSKGKVFAELDAPANIRIFNQLGQTVAQRTNCTGKVSFNLTTPGIYVMEVSGSTFRTVKQIVVTK